MKRVFEKSVVAVADIPKGTTIEARCSLPRTGTGIPLHEITEVVGRTARADIAATRRNRGSDRMKKVCIVVGSRATYSSIKSAMRAIDAHRNSRCSSSWGLRRCSNRYGTVLDLI